MQDKWIYLYKQTNMNPFCILNNDLQVQGKHMGDIAFYPHNSAVKFPQATSKSSWLNGDCNPGLSSPTL